MFAISEDSNSGKFIIFAAVIVIFVIISLVIAKILIQRNALLEMQTAADIQTGEKTARKIKIGIEAE